MKLDLLNAVLHETKESGKKNVALPREILSVKVHNYLG